MKINIKSIILIIFCFSAGIILGRWFFTPDFSDNHLMQDHQAHQPEEAATAWTCSMHPQIKQPEPGQCPICGMDLIPLESMTNENPMALTMTEDAVKLANIQTVTVGSTPQMYGNNEGGWLINGKILPDERQIYAQTPHINGRIESLAVTYEGMYVKKGSQIAELYSPEIIAAQRELLEAQKLENVNPNLIEAARDKLRFLKISEDFITNLENSGNIVETFPLLAGKSGYVLNKNVEIGDHVVAGEVLFDIYNLGSVWAGFDVYEKDISKVKIGDVIAFKAPAVPDQLFKTRIDFINPLLDQKTRAIRIRGQVNNRGGLLKPQMLIRGKIDGKLPDQQEALLVPKTAVLWTGRESVVYVKDTSMHVPTFSFREVTLGNETDGYYQVMDGLSPGEEVVTNGVFAVDASAQLNNQRSMMNRMVNTPEEKDQEESVQQVDPKALSSKALGDLEKILNGYLSLKDDLITGQEDQIATALDNINAISRQLEPREDLGQYNEAWNRHVRHFKRHLQLMLEEKDVDGWRQTFVSLSSVMVHWVREFGNPGHQNVFIQQCPMADNNHGADWLSVDADIRNPYFGEQMMTCGMTIDTILKF